MRRSDPGQAVAALSYDPFAGTPESQYQAPTSLESRGQRPIAIEEAAEEAADKAVDAASTMPPTAVIRLGSAPDLAPDTPPEAAPFRPALDPLLRRPGPRAAAASHESSGNARTAWRDIHAVLQVQLQSGDAGPPHEGQAGDPDAHRLTLNVVGIAIERGQRLILASDSPFSVTDVIALDQIEVGIDPESNAPIEDLWSWLAMQDHLPGSAARLPASTS